MNIMFYFISHCQNNVQRQRTWRKFSSDKWVKNSIYLTPTCELFLFFNLLNIIKLNENTVKGSLIKGPLI